MQLENKFTIDAPIDKAWEALNTPETVAPCFPGATLQEYEGDSFTGTVKVKLGPISLTYKGKGTYVTRDDANHKVVIEANGRDSRGNGTASATVTGTMVADGPNRTAVTMVTDMTITGRPAQFGRGVISDVADKIIGQFSACVASKLAPAAEAPAAAAPAPAKPSPSPAAPSGEGASAPAAAAGTVAAPATSGRTNGSGSAEAAAAAKGPVLAPKATTSSGPLRSEVDAIDLLDTAGAPVLKRLAPVAGGALLLLIIFLIRRARR
ncbi:carbon monoxide dehydrogenase subunit G [Pseudonocardia hierapolitana]|uniref:Carbon monoxide dehydrogenase subunit G n=1 Tax=Pseudonocardia hierapolitana TaxID=1128676 RepID=A0A561ST77_9PSEU|nr:SRPBCC family protein [Pseudonocardia hierapolitana]TWF78049.1 carbon monoxide dehydrogenase subunit G [Pseudonocardia hierapolitana]